MTMYTSSHLLFLFFGSYEDDCRSGDTCLRPLCWSSGCTFHGMVNKSRCHMSSAKKMILSSQRYRTRTHLSLRVPGTGGSHGTPKCRRQNPTVTGLPLVSSPSVNPRTLYDQHPKIFTMSFCTFRLSTSDLH